ncbi:MAG TPA: glutaredoxin domain-containing protein, partial [Anaerolineae bacterium]|nr:glutaredoxin domain-containing protein [Anaerolineae bacterium]
VCGQARFGYNRNMMKLMMFTRTFGCSDQKLARNCLAELNIRPIELNISIDRDAAQTLMKWVGSLSVPTLVVTDDHDQPIMPPQPLRPDQHTRNTDRGSMISEPNCASLRLFLKKHGFISDHDHPSNT